MKILLVEDEQAIAEPLTDGLEREGFDVVHVPTGADALAASGYDLVLLDLRLPDIDGLDVAKQIRATSSVPVIITTARGDEVDVIVGLELGADDYVVKPFSTRHIIARIRAVARRSSHDDHRDGRRLEVGSLVVDRDARIAELGDRRLDLTPREFELLARLAQTPGVVLSRERIYEDVWGGRWFGSTKTIDVHIAALRRKLGDPDWILASRGVGFQLIPFA